MKEDEILNQCLVYEVLRDIEGWLGYASTHNLSAFLGGAAFRVLESGNRIPEWKINGPLAEKEINQPIVASTGHPTLSINWPTALEFVNFKNSDSVFHLTKLIESFHNTRGIDSIDKLYPQEEYELKGIDYHLGRLAKRPGMYTGRNDGWSFYCWLMGLIRGGDWLDLPKLEGLENTYKKIANRSFKAYGSEWAAFKITEPKELLSWADIKPID